MAQPGTKLPADVEGGSPTGGVERNGLRILLTNSSLGLRGGSELYTRDLAVALMRRGHFPIAFSPLLGDVAADLDRATIPVIDNLDAITEPPDLIHGHHHLETMAAVLRFGRTPAVHACHGWAPWEERPTTFPTIQRYVAVSDLLRHRLVTRAGIPPERVSVVYSFVDTDRFQPRAASLAELRSAAFFGNHVRNDGRAALLRRACQRSGIERFDLIGYYADNHIADPAEVLPRYDVVFAMGRCALEAMAVGCAVIVSDGDGLAGLVTTSNVARLRRMNCGARAVAAAPVTEDRVVDELQRIDPDEVGRVRDWVRANATLALATDAWLAVYARVLADWSDPAARQRAEDPARQGRSAARYLQTLSGMTKERSAVDHSVRRLERELARARANLTQAKEAAAKRQTDTAERVAHAQKLLKETEADTARRLAQAEELLKETEADAARRLAQTEELFRKTEAEAAQRLAQTEQRLMDAEATLAATLRSRSWRWALRLEKLRRILFPGSRPS